MNFIHLAGRLLRTLRLSRDTCSLDAALRRRRMSGPVATVIDVGASDGRWSRVARRFFPAAEFLLVEAQETHRQALEILSRKVSSVKAVVAAAGDHDGTIYFDAADPFGGAASHADFLGSIVTPMRSIDSLVDEYRLPPPYLLKLDTHGFELPILRGAEQTLRQASLVIIESYNFRIFPNALTFPEMCGHMETLGFRCIDMCDPMFRPKDGALWQMDLFFAPASASEFLSERYEP